VDYPCLSTDQNTSQIKSRLTPQPNLQTVSLPTDSLPSRVLTRCNNSIMSLPRLKVGRITGVTVRAHSCIAGSVQTPKIVGSSTTLTQPSTSPSSAACARADHLSPWQRAATSSGLESALARLGFGRGFCMLVQALVRKMPLKAEETFSANPDVGTTLGATALPLRKSVRSSGPAACTSTT
jgi:hypothetical protein